MFLTLQNFLQLQSLPAFLEILHADNRFYQGIFLSP